jgi:hypothetical protein
METMWLAKPKILTMWPFTKRIWPTLGLYIWGFQLLKFLNEYKITMGRKVGGKETMGRLIKAF